MSFASVSFLLFFLVVLLLLLLVQRVLPFAEIKCRIICQGILLIASYVFYGWWNMRLCLLLMGITWISFFTAVKKDEKHLRQSRISLLIGVGTPLAVLGIFKYYDFFVTSFCDVFHLTPGVLNLILPVGISFYTFQALSYTIDVYTGKIEKEKSFLQFALYLSFFPQLVAGPIVRARDFIPQIRQPLFVSSEMFGTGVFFIISGLFKKAVISDYISVNFVERIFDNPALYSGVENLFGVYGYALQIYCDFSGYSDMAIGFALLLGFRFPMNFNSPYKADSITDFWHRWHISLSTWLRDYLYISLGGNRKGKARTYINLCLTMLLGGLWHGASWNFVIWGGFHGIALAAQKFWRNLLHKPKTATSKGIRKFFAVLITFNFVCFCWIFFRNTTFEASVVMLKQICTAFHPEVFMQLIEGYWKVFVLMGIGYLLHFAPDSWQDACCRGVVKLPLLGKALLLVVLIYLVIQIKSSDIQPFIYFQF